MMNAQVWCGGIHDAASVGGIISVVLTNSTRWLLQRRPAKVSRWKKHGIEVVIISGDSFLSWNMRRGWTAIEPGTIDNIITLERTSIGFDTLVTAMDAIDKDSWYHIIVTVLSLLKYGT